ncbi:hypothetical protein [Shewanella sp. Isolate11]|uniref:hypothetical protein n=1 Tax=Shewanella sp. Isolate11 TaxID=2908530 RepID=UPI001EFC315B|nr:hypothetical protein [Shewanella sp. Isolate11]MCG9695864.1 hypothetical protein [Shewanella sp. Isolate11]
MNKWLFLALLAVGGCANDFSFTIEQPPEEDPLEVKDPMSQDNERIIEQARDDGRLDTGF